MWFQIFILAFSFVWSYFNRPKTTKPQAAELSEFDFPQCEEGTGQLVVFGQVWISTMVVVGLGNYRTTEIKR